MNHLSKFYGHWSILLLFGIFYGHLEYCVHSHFGIFFPLWYVVPRNIWQPCVCIPTYMHVQLMFIVPMPVRLHSVSCLLISACRDVGTLRGIIQNKKMCCKTQIPRNASVSQMMCNTNCVLYDSKFVFLPTDL
jgi:hypothetical protein